MKTFSFLSCALFFVGMATGQDISIRLSTGKLKYIPEEPVYFKIVLTNHSQKFIGYNSQLSMGVGSFTFCEEKSKRCIEDADIMNQSCLSHFVGNLAPGKSYRLYGTLFSHQAHYLLEANPGSKILVVKPTLLCDTSMKNQSSKPWTIEMTHGSPHDDSLLAELKRLGTLDIKDNASGSGILSFSLQVDFGSRQIGGSKSIEISRTLRKYSHSRLYPYLLSYLSEMDPPALTHSENATLDAFLKRKPGGGNVAFGDSDPYLRLFNLLRCAQREIRDESLPHPSSKPCRDLVLKDLIDGENSEFFREPGIAPEQIEDYDLVRILRPDIFSKELEAFLSTGTFKPHWKDTLGVK